MAPQGSGIIESLRATFIPIIVATVMERKMSESTIAFRIFQMVPARLGRLRLLKLQEAPVVHKKLLEMLMVSKKNRSLIKFSLPRLDPSPALVCKS